jgi:predicted DNA-binding transcriptional regulator AlpA
LKEFEYNDYEKGNIKMFCNEKDNLITLRLVAEYTGETSNTILALSEVGSFPSPIVVDGDELWLCSGIADWLENQANATPTIEWGEAS